MAYTRIRQGGGGGGGGGGNIADAVIRNSYTWAGKPAASSNAWEIVRISDISSLNSSSSVWLSNGAEYMPVTIPKINWADLSDSAKFGATLAASAATYAGCEFFIQDYGINGFVAASNGSRWLASHRIINCFSDGTFSITATAGGGEQDVITATIPAGLAKAGDYWEACFSVEKSGTAAESTKVAIYVGSAGSSATDTLSTSYTGLSGSTISASQIRRIFIASDTQTIDEGPQGATAILGVGASSVSNKITVDSVSTADHNLTIALTTGATDNIVVQTALINFVTAGA